MIYVPKAKNTLLMPSGTFETPDKKHLFIIMTEKCSNNQHLVVSVSSIKAGVFHDTSTILEVGCHTFITVPSYVFYAKAALLRHEKIAKCVDGWLYTPRENISDAVFEKVCAGITISDHTPLWAVDYFNSNNPLA